MLMMTFFPQKFFKVMDPIVEEYRKPLEVPINQDVIEKAKGLTKQFWLEQVSVVFLFWLPTLFRQY